jgi:hypothetical protein
MFQSLSNHVDCVWESPRGMTCLRKNKFLTSNKNFAGPPVRSDIEFASPTF